MPQVVDVWVLLLLHAQGGAQRKAAEGLVVRKAAAGQLSSQLLQSALLGHAAALKESFPALLALAEVTPFPSKPLPSPLASSICKGVFSLLPGPRRDEHFVP